MNKIKVLQYPTPLAKGGGISQYILNNLKYIDKFRYHCDFFTLSKERLEIQDELNRQGCKVHYISCRPEEEEYRFISELNSVLDEGYDAIHLHTSYWTGYLIEEIAVRNNIPVIAVHSHSTEIDVADAEKRLRAAEMHERLKSAFSSNLATHFCACSKKAADWLYGEQIPRDRIVILNNAIDTEKFAYKPDIREKYRKDLGIDDCFVIGYTGRLCYQKNPGMLIDILNNVCKALPQARLLVVGIGELLEDVKEQAGRYGLSRNALFLGYRTDTSELLQAMDVFVLPSRFEGFGIVLVEAQCAGLPCLASEFVPSDAKLTDNLDFLPYNANAWADRIIEIADSLYTRKDMSDEISKAGFSVKEQIKILERIYSNEL